jgi:hypothetical protein
MSSYSYKSKNLMIYMPGAVDKEKISALAPATCRGPGTLKYRYVLVPVS